MSRPRKFDEEAVIAQAMDLFWQKGFAGTPLDTIEEITGLNRSSIYNSFGGKLELFCKSLDAYSAGPCRELARPFQEKRGADAIYGYLDRLRAFVRSRDLSKGCLMVNTSIESIADEKVRQRVNTHFRILRADFHQAYSVAIEDGTLSQTLTPEEAADWLLMFVRGVLVGAVTGESAAVLDRSITTAMKQMGLRGH